LSGTPAVKSAFVRGKIKCFVVKRIIQRLNTHSIPNKS
jgi:hypothetical protein